MTNHKDNPTEICLAPESNAVLAQRIAELTSELTTANSMHLDNDRYKYEQRGFGCVDDLLLHFDALKAQVEQLNQRNNELEVMQPSYNLLRNAFYDGACWNESTINNGALSLDKNAHEYANEKLAELTPAQCLAERDIATIQAFANKYCGECRSDEQVWLKRKALEYCNQLRQQASK